jgi:uncharacterized protein YjiS (DUF1127 family)
MTRRCLATLPRGSSRAWPAYRQPELAARPSFDRLTIPTFDVLFSRSPLPSVEVEDGYDDMGQRCRSASLGRTELGYQLDWLMRCVKRRRQRIALVKLSDLVLRDIGLTRIDVAMEADKRFWRP